MGRLDGKVAIITGATSGLGEAAAELFAEEGAKVVFAGRRAELGDPIEKKLKDMGYDVKFVATDIRNTESLQNLIDTTINTYGGIDILFNNAAISIYETFLEMSEETANDILDTNYRSMYVLCKMVMPIMIEQGRGGAVVNTSSIGGFKGGKKLVAYCGSKGAVRLFSKALASEMAEHNIRVNSLHPGLILTEMAFKEPGFAERGAVADWQCHENHHKPDDRSSRRIYRSRQSAARGV